VVEVAHEPAPSGQARPGDAPPQTELSFTLPHGLVAADGTVHRHGSMRMATAYDEIAPLGDPRVRSNPAYLVVILLSRVITRLGDLEFLNPKLIESLYAADLAHLQDLYQRMNTSGHNRLVVDCPHCDETFEVEVPSLGG
jgi:hypothetical protein